MTPISSPRRQKGAILITTALLLFLAIGVMGIALDFGRLFVIKSEMQTAVDSCALSSAKELDGRPSAIARAINAGLSAGTINRVNFQSIELSGAGQLSAEDITFRDVDNLPTTDPAAARYAECTHTQPSVSMLLLDAMGTFSGNTATFPSTMQVATRAIATRASAQTACPLPLALKPKAGGAAPNYGFVRGEWVRLLMGPGAGSGGEIGWANLDGTNSASETQAEMRGFCGTSVGDELGTPGVQLSVADEWNARFGIYRGSVKLPDDLETHAYMRPDASGYAYTGVNWPTRFGAYDDYLAKQLAYAGCGTAVGPANRPGTCANITGLTLNGFSQLAPAGSAATGGHRQYGTSRRIALVPVVNNARQVIDYACMLMLQPIPVPMASIDLEYLGHAGDPDVPCTTAGLPGGTVGPLAPVLVQ